jgi:hypothetical protein
MTSQLPVLSLCKTIKAHLAKGDKARDKAEQHFVSAGRHLVELKERCPDEWLRLAKENIGIGRSRAYELLMIGTGKRTDKQVRENTRQRVENHRVRYGNGQVAWIHEYRTDDGRWIRGEECPNFVPSCECGAPFVSKDGTARLIPVPRT